jgi:hypothetical protein
MTCKLKYPRLYFTSWFLEQNYSLSGFIHIKATLNFNNLCQHINITQNNNTFQYSLKTYRSQDEEMSLMGALLYGSLVIHHEHLLLNTVKQMIKPFHSSIRSIEMIFVRSEHSKKEVGQRTPQQIYNGSKKSYSRGDMLFFVPVMPKVEEDYSQCKLYF